MTRRIYTKVRNPVILGLIGSQGREEEAGRGAARAGSEEASEEGEGKVKPIGGYTVADREPILRFKCPRCGAQPHAACKSVNGNECIPHKDRVVRSRQGRTTS